MARQPGNKSGGTSRIRLVVLEAELGDGSDVAQLAQALSNALRPQQVPQTRSVSNTIASQGLPSPQVSNEETAIPQDAMNDIEDAEVQPKKPRDTRPRRPTVPKAFDYDAAAVASWKAFANDKNVDSDAGRFLIVAAWHNDHRNEEPITQSHVYACYRHMKWPIGLPDFGQPLRKLKYDQKLVGGAKDGYTITQIGLQAVDEMN